MTGALVLAIIAAATGYLAWIYTHPFKPCPRCSGKGTNPLSTRRRFGTCSRCKGTRQVRTLGSRALHRAARSAASYRNDRKS